MASSHLTEVNGKIMVKRFNPYLSKNNFAGENQFENSSPRQNYEHKYGQMDEIFTDNQIKKFQKQFSRKFSKEQCLRTMQCSISKFVFQNSK